MHCMITYTYNNFARKSEFEGALLFQSGRIKLINDRSTFINALGITSNTTVHQEPNYPLFRIAMNTQPHNSFNYLFRINCEI